MLRTRVASAVVFAPLLIAIVWFGTDRWFDLFVALLIALGGWEWARLAGLQQPLPRAGYAIVAGGLGLAASKVGLSAAFWLNTAVLVWAINAAWLSRHRFLAEETTAASVTKALVGLLVLTLAAVALITLHQAEYGAELTLLLLVLIWAADVGAYFAGRTLGRHKLAPAISPAKTWEGVFGGQLAALAVIGIVQWAQLLPLEMSPWWYLVAVITAGISVVGDLFVSLLKRQTGIKDTGRLIPGHGGILDRFDSAFAAAPFFAGGLALVLT